jgi:hypothetical protein
MGFRIVFFCIVKFLKFLNWMFYVANAFENYFNNGHPWKESWLLAHKEVYEVDPQLKKEIQEMIRKTHKIQFPDNEVRQ